MHGGWVGAVEAVLRGLFGGRRVWRFAAASCVTVAIAACGTEAGTATDAAGDMTIDDARAAAIAEAVTFEAADVDPELVNDTDTVSEAVDLQACTPSLKVLAQAPWRSFGTPGENARDAEVENFDVEAAVDELAFVTFATAVYQSIGEADQALETLAGTIESEEVMTICGTGEDAVAAADGSEVVPADVDRDLADELVAFELVDSSSESGRTRDGRPLLLLARNGPALTVLGGFAGPSGDLDTLVRSVTAQIKTSVNAELAGEG